ncbi:hypothetical protein [Henriciella aquimarina]|uniref:hypothetical protein n=1 Tax=Henriciella aquimarina TaxID=545261 RepID=UPI00117B5CF8|nr:hypothetical protein [Henriciella aquimarina]
MARGREKGPWFWRGMIGAMLAGVFGLFALAAFSASPSVLPETGCRMDHKDPAHTVLLIDQSDPFNPNDLGWVNAFIDSEARTLPRFGRITVVTPNSEDPYDARIVYSHCSPGAAQDANPILQNPRMIEDTWRETFYEPMSKEVETALTDTRQPSSPLFEAVYSIADRADFQASRGDRRIILISDLMQHSDEFSFYRTGTDKAAFAETRLADRVPDMEGVEIVARVVPRQEYDLPMSDVKRFWRDYFDRTGAAFSSVN